MDRGTWISEAHQKLSVAFETEELKLFFNLKFRFVFKNRALNLSKKLITEMVFKMCYSK